MRLIYLFASSLILSVTLFSNTKSYAYEAPFAKQTPLIDGIDNDPAWQLAKWKNIDKLTLGDMPSESDFSGRFKVVWTKYRIYLLAEIVDDVLFDSHPNPLDSYWDDDALEIFIDEDKSGGNHQFNYNAFAYHIALDNQSIDIGPPLADKPNEVNFRTYNDHITSKWQRSANSPHKIIWEVAISVYGDDYKDSYAPGEKVAKPKILNAGKVLGFMVAYCDNDGSEHREHFLSSEDIAPVNGDKNRGYIDASVFGELKLK